ncbi:MAG TPA: hypothetical protein VIC05_04675 [Solirubrobacteraceae bacterium]
MHSSKLELALESFIDQAAAHLRQEITDGAEVPFELATSPGRGQRTPLYSYRPLTARFIRERAASLRALESYPPAAQLIAGAAGLERYLTAKDAGGLPPGSGKASETALLCLLCDVFAEQTEFEPNHARVAAALQSLGQSAAVRAEEVTLLAGLRGIALVSRELVLTRGLLLAAPEMLDGLPEQLAHAGESGPQLLALYTSEEPDVSAALAQGHEVLHDLLRSLRLFGDARITLEELAWVRVGQGSWRPVATSSRGRPHGMLLVTDDQEDELRAFCNLVSRRAPSDTPIAWALERFQVGCEQPSEHRALSDYLLALRALLEPEGADSGLLAGRLAALCATVEERAELNERICGALALERAVIAGTARSSASEESLIRSLADHLRALLRDVICGHLDPELTLLADELLHAAAGEPEQPSQPVRAAFDELELAFGVGESPAGPVSFAGEEQGVLWPEQPVAGAPRH